MLHLPRAFGRALLLAAPLAALTTALIQQPLGAQAPKSVEAMLKEGEWDYVKTKDGFFKVVVTLKNDTSLVMLSETEVIPDKAGKYKTIGFDGLVVDVPDNFKHPAAMLKKLAVLNDRLTLGRLSMDETSGDVYYRSQVWMRAADADMLTTEIILAHYNLKSCKKELEPFVEE